MSISTVLQDSLADFLASQLDTAQLTIYTGTVPSSASAAITTQGVKAQHTLTGFKASVSGVIVANAVANSPIGGNGAEDITFVRLTKGTNILQLLVGTTGTPVIVPSTVYTAGGTSIITSITLTQPAN